MKVTKWTLCQKLSSKILKKLINEKKQNKKYISSTVWNKTKKGGSCLK